MKRYLFLLLLSLGITMAACSDSDEPTGPVEKEDPVNPTEKDQFEFEIREVTTRTASIRVTPQDVTSPYLTFAIDRMTFDTWGADFFIGQFLDEMKEADINLRSEVIVGPKNTENMGMMPGTEYTAVAFGYSLEGEPTTKLFYKHFETRSKVEHPIDVTFDIRIDDLAPDGAIIDITPSDNSVVYAVFAGEDALIELHGDDLYGAAQDMVAYIEADGQTDWGNYDSSQNIRKGPATLDYRGMLSGNRGQAVIAFAINRYGEVTSEVGCKRFRTPAPEASTSTFDFDIRNVTFNSAEVTITPSEKITYYANVAVKAFMESMTEEQFVEGMLSQYVMETVIPCEIFERGTLEPETDYVAFAFGAQAGCATTQLFKEEFRTPAFVYKSGGDAWVDQTVTSVMDGALYLAHGYGIIDVLYIPNEETVEYYMAMPPMETEDEWFNMSEDELKQAIIREPYSNNHDATNHCQWADLLGRTTTLYVVGEDKDGYFGKINEMRFKVELSSSFGVDSFSSTAKWMRPEKGNGPLAVRKAPVRAFEEHTPRMK